MNMNEGPLDTANVGWDWGWEVGVGSTGESSGGKMETTVFEHQLKKVKKEKKKNVLKINIFFKKKRKRTLHLNCTGQNSRWAIVTHKDQLQCLKLSEDYGPAIDIEASEEDSSLSVKSLFEPGTVIWSWNWGITWLIIWHMSNCWAWNNILQVIGNLASLSDCYPPSVYFRDPIQPTLLFWPYH